MTSIRWTHQAVEDLEAIRDYIARDSDHYARLVIERLIESVERLRRFPESGRIVPELGNPSVREVIRPPWRIVYRTQAESIEVLTVFRASRQIPEIESAEPD